MAHITVMVFALLANLLIAGMVMTEGTRILTQLTEGNFFLVVCPLLRLVYLKRFKTKTIFSKSISFNPLTAGAAYIRVYIFH